MNTRKTTEENLTEEPCWYLMTHLEMSRFKDWLETENAARLGDGRAIIEPFFPGEFLKGRRTTKKDAPVGQQTPPEDDTARAHIDFQNLVFLKATKRDIDRLVFDRWNLDFRIRLMYYLDTTGKPATVSAIVMQNFFEACLKYRGRFELCPSIDGIEKTDRVEIKTGPFAGYEASVLGVRHAKGEIHLKLAVELVSGVMHIEMKDVNRHQVVILNRSETDFIRNDFIKYTQNHLLPIIGRRVKRIDDEDSKRRDAAMLTRLYRYRHHQVENEAARIHFLALMLICAHLCRDEEGKTELQQQAQQTLANVNARGEAQATTDARTYLWVALYIATADPHYRDAAKQYVQACQPKSTKLRRFVSLIRSGRKI